MLSNLVKKHNHLDVNLAEERLGFLALLTPRPLPVLVARGRPRRNPAKLGGQSGWSAQGQWEGLRGHRPPNGLQHLGKMLLDLLVESFRAHHRGCESSSDNVNYPGWEALFLQGTTWRVGEVGIGRGLQGIN